MIVRQLTRKAEILSVLEADRLYAAYPIGDLTDNLFGQCQWAAAEKDGRPVALAMTFSGLQTPAVFVMGEPAGVQAILRSGLRPPNVYLTLRPEHMPAVAGIYRMSDERCMWRMAVDRESFTPVDSVALRRHSADIARLNTLYSWGGPGFFAAYQVEQGVYYAIEHDGELVAAAGTHVVAPEYGIAAIGNVYTSLEWRGRGLATACTSAVAAELLDLGCRSVVLNVHQDNAAAIRAYRRLGFRTHCSFIEARARRRPHVEQIVRRFIFSSGT